MARTTGFNEVSQRYEGWRARRIPVIGADVKVKYARMAASPWWLARGGYHRYATQFGALLPELAGAPLAVSAGDLHLENFGTWRDRVGRLIWGVRRLEEVDLLPYTADLVRLASSVLLASTEGLLAFPPDRVAEAILAGWSERISSRSPEPFALGVAHRDLYEAHVGALSDPVSFNAAMLELVPFERALSKPAARMLASVTPPGGRVQLKRAPTGFSDLGARRIVALVDIDGGLLAREIVQVPGPVSMWAAPKRAQVSGLVSAIDAARGLAAEPWRRQSRKWVVRGLDGALTELTLPNPTADPPSLLAKMGAEAANLHLTEVSGAAARKSIRRDAASRAGGWLQRAAEIVLEATRADHAEWSASLAAGDVPDLLGDAEG